MRRVYLREISVLDVDSSAVLFTTVDITFGRLFTACSLCAQFGQPIVLDANTMDVHAPRKRESQLMAGTMRGSARDGSRSGWRLFSRVTVSQ